MTTAVALTSANYTALLAAGTDVTVSAGTNLVGLIPPGTYVLIDAVSGAVSATLIVPSASEWAVSGGNFSSLPSGWLVSGGTIFDIPGV